MSKTKLFDVECRKQLVAGGKQAIDASEDPLIRMARQTAPILWEMRTWKEKTVHEDLESALRGARDSSWSKHVKDKYETTV